MSIYLQHHFFPLFPEALAPPFAPDSSSSLFVAVFFPFFAAVADGSSATSFDALGFLALLALGSVPPSPAAFFALGFLAGATLEAEPSRLGILGLAS